MRRPSLRLDTWQNDWFQSQGRAWSGSSGGNYVYNGLIDDHAHPWSMRRRSPKFPRIFKFLQKNPGEGVKGISIEEAIWSVEKTFRGAPCKF